MWRETPPSATPPPARPVAVDQGQAQAGGYAQSQQPATNGSRIVACPHCNEDFTQSGISIHLLSEILDATKETSPTERQWGRAVILVVAAVFFAFAGNQMTGIRSISGDSIAEAFYQGVGVLSYGLALASVALAIPIGR